METPVLTQDKAIKVLNYFYDRAINGMSTGNTGIKKMTQNYHDKYSTKENACKAMLKDQIIKCASVGVITGLGGISTLPTNMVSVMCIQLRMIACTAYMAGFEPENEQTQTLVLACFIGITISQMIKQTGVKFTTKMTTKAIEKNPGKVLTAINQKIGYRFITKFGSKGTVNLGKTVPVLGAIAGGSIDYLESKVIAKRAYKYFFSQ